MCVPRVRKIIKFIVLSFALYFGPLELHVLFKYNIVTTFSHCKTIRVEKNPVLFIETMIHAGGSKRLQKLQAP